MPLRAGDLRQARIEPRDRVVELACDALLARDVLARGGLGNPFDLLGDRVEPLVDVGDFAALLTGALARHVLRTLVVGSAKVRRDSLAERGVQPIVE